MFSWTVSLRKVLELILFVPSAIVLSQNIENAFDMIFFILNSPFLVPRYLYNKE